MASFPSLSSQVVRATTEEENGELDQSLQQMLKAIADERNRLNIRQEISGLGKEAGWAEVPHRGEKGSIIIRAGFVIKRLSPDLSVCLSYLSV